MGLEDRLSFKVPKDTLNDNARKVLTTEALQFVADLVDEFANERTYLLHLRQLRQQDYNKGETPAFVPHFADGAEIKKSAWKVAPPPKDLRKRWVEITGPANDRKGMIYRLNSGADVTMEDFEDSLSPTWNNIIQGQLNLMDAIDWSISFTKEDGTEIRLNDTVATLMVRPRGWHLEENHVLLDGKPIPAGLFDFGLYFFHNARELVYQGSTPALYLPKMESRFEAKLWNSVFDFAQERAFARDATRIPQGTIRATVLIETLPAIFEAEEILYELRDHTSGLNCGRWDYIFSYIKKLNQHADKILPDRDQVTMTQPFLQSYVDLLIQTCHKRGAYAMGGMAAQIPLKDTEANEKAMAAVQADKEREVKAGHDGTWIAHPGLVKLARDVFENGLKGQDTQLSNLREDVTVTAEDLLRVPEGTRTYEGLKKNIRAGVHYLAAWLSGNGCVPLEGKMEDAATVEISRAQIWQQLHHKVKLDSGKVNFYLDGTVNWDLYCHAVMEVMGDIYKSLEKDKKQVKGAKGHSHTTENQKAMEKAYVKAQHLFDSMIWNHRFEDFLTMPAYNQLIAEGK